MITGAFLTSGILSSSADVCFFRTPCHRGKNGWHDLPCRRAGATPRTFWAAESRKSGVAPARFDVFSTVTFAFPGFVLLRFPRTSDLFRVKKCQFQKVQSVILAFFTRYSLNPRQAQYVAAETCRSQRCASCHSFQPPAGCRFR